MSALSSFLDIDSPSMIFAAHAEQYQLFVDQTEKGEPKARFLVVDTSNNDAVVIDTVLDLTPQQIAYPSFDDVMDWYSLAEDHITLYQEASA